MIAPTPYFADRGCHVRIYEEAKALQRLGCEVVICTYHIGRDQEGIRTERIPNVPWYGKLEAGPSWWKPFLDMLLLAKVIVTARTFAPHVIHAHLHEGAFVGRIARRMTGLPLLFDYQGSMTEEMADHRFMKRGGVLFRLFSMIEKYVDRGADVIVTSSRENAGTLTERFGLSPDRVVPLPDGVDTDLFSPGSPPAGLRDRLGIPEGRKVVVYLGVLSEYQGVDLLLNAAVKVVERSPETHFLIMGYPGVERYGRMAKKLGLEDNVTFTGRIDYADAPRFLRLGDVAVSAKLSRTEGNGKIYNYMASGLPTVCFDTPVNRAILGDLGIYAPFGDGDALAGAMAGIVADDEGLEALGKSVRIRAVENFSWRERGEKLLDLYVRLTAAERG